MSAAAHGLRHAREKERTVTRQKLREATVPLMMSLAH